MFTSCLLYETVPDIDRLDLPESEFTDLYLKKNMNQYEIDIVQQLLNRFCDGENQFMLVYGDIGDFYKNLPILVDAAFSRAKLLSNPVLKFSMAEIENNKQHDLLSSKPLDTLTELQTLNSPSKLLSLYAPNYDRHFLFKLKLIFNHKESVLQILFLNFTAYDSFLTDFITYAQNMQNSFHFLSNNQILIQLTNIFNKPTSVTQIFHFRNDLKDLAPNLLFFNQTNLRKIRSPKQTASKTHQTQRTKSQSAKDINQRIMSKQFVQEQTTPNQMLQIKYSNQIESLAKEIILMQEDLDKIRRQQFEDEDLFNLFQMGKTDTEILQMTGIKDVKLLRLKQNLLLVDLTTLTMKKTIHVFCNRNKPKETPIETAQKNVLMEPIKTTSIIKQDSKRDILNTIKKNDSDLKVRSLKKSNSNTIKPSPSQLNIQTQIFKEELPPVPIPVQEPVVNPPVQPEIIVAPVESLPPATPITENREMQTEPIQLHSIANASFSKTSKVSIVDPSTDFEAIQAQILNQVKHYNYKHSGVIQAHLYQKSVQSCMINAQIHCKILKTMRELYQNSNMDVPELKKMFVGLNLSLVLEIEYGKDKVVNTIKCNELLSKIGQQCFAKKNITECSVFVTNSGDKYVLGGNLDFYKDWMSIDE
ncbi:Hypothetical_protein [Hexamita inflata]|uniref:Hypothetical_protein n=1 Tax=Hexamita inflata TaxID=28002 RepID=A0AA86Q934_9EUKA|nr:Hypothetical protein HINF_LOCUS36097 [Hexamita inflata]CAI9959672.1 Hypothetical protein HINF_LOCUS47317 [Hexamita inflata]